MEKRYQVFVSSTFSDLKEERQEVIQALLELDCIPSGMELFPAANEDQWSLIKKVIEDCDYYIVIVGGRYGSMGPDGLSFTEMEYRFATEKGKPILGFIHKYPSKIEKGRSEASEEGSKKLEEFRELVQRKMCRYWENPTELGSQVSRSLIKLIKNVPAVGWVRGDFVSDEVSSAEVLKLKKEIDDLKEKLNEARISAPEGASDLAQGEEMMPLDVHVLANQNDYSFNSKWYSMDISLNWNELFYAASPIMLGDASEEQIKDELNAYIAMNYSYKFYENDEFSKMKISKVELSSQDFQTIKVQFKALGLIRRSEKQRSIKDASVYWTLTPYGDEVMTRLRAIRKVPVGSPAGHS